MNIYYDYDLVYANWNILIGINRSEGAGFEPASRAAARRTDCKSAAMDLAMRPLHVRRVGGFEPPHSAWKAPRLAINLISTMCRIRFLPRP